jgi:high affinity sulfate transporter 1
MTEQAPVPGPHGGRGGESGRERRRTWARWVPAIDVVRGYRLEWLRHDVAAGLILTSMLVPVGIAYAQASGLPGIHGLYATIVPLLAYAIFGPSRILVIAPDSALAALILTVVLSTSGGDPERAVAVAGAMALVCGLVCIAAGLGRLGFVTELLSKPIRYGYMNGIAITVILSQAPKLFGFPVDESDPLRQALAILRGLAEGQGNLATALIGAATLGVILGLRRFPLLPGMLVAVALATVLVAAFDLDVVAGVSVIGAIPAGLPNFAIPAITVDDLMPVLAGGTAVALIAFADTSVLSRTYAARLRVPVDPNQEMVGLGVANLATGLFQGFPISSSSSRTPIAEAAGARTQVTGVVGALATAVLLVLAPDLLAFLPDAALAAVVIVAAVGLFEIADLRRIHRIQRWEFWLSMACCAGVLVLGVLEGIALAILIAVVEFLWDGWRPHSAVLGRVDNVKGYHDVTRYPAASRIPGLVLFRWDAPLFFANAELFRDRIMDALAESPTRVNWLVVAAEPVTSVDVTAADMLSELDEQLHAAGVELCFAEMKDPVKDKLKRFGLFARFGAETFFPTLGQAVSAYLASHAVDWVDWQDRDEST